MIFSSGEAARSSRGACFSFFAPWTAKTVKSVPFQMAGDMLSVVTVEREAPTTSGGEAELAAERAKLSALEAQAAKHREQIADYEGQLAGLKMGLEGLQGELERCQNAGFGFDDSSQEFAMQDR